MKGDILGVIVTVIDMVTWVQILNKSVYISHKVNPLRKAINPSISRPAMGK